MLKAVNWSSYQSYKDRKPPWIRLHKSLLDNYEYQSMSAEARALLPMLWLLASEDDDPTSGLVTDSLQKISFRLRINVEVLAKALKEIIKAGFFEEIQSCNDSVTDPLRNRTQTVTPETETETETDISFKNFWDVYPRREDKKKAEQKWKHLKNPDRESAIRDCATRYIGVDKKFIPLPTTYLNGERWNDEKPNETKSVAVVSHASHRPWRPE